MFINHDQGYGHAYIEIALKAKVSAILILILILIVIIIVDDLITFKLNIIVIQIVNDRCQC